MENGERRRIRAATPVRCPVITLAPSLPNDMTLLSGVSSLASLLKSAVVMVSASSIQLFNPGKYHLDVPVWSNDAVVDDHLLRNRDVKRLVDHDSDELRRAHHLHHVSASNAGQNAQVLPADTIRQIGLHIDTRNIRETAIQLTQFRQTTK